MFDTLVFAVRGFLALLLLWLVVRVAAAAFFKTKQDFERNEDGTQKHPK